MMSKNSTYEEIPEEIFYSSDPTDIMYPASTRSDIDLNDFIRAKDRMFERKFSDTGIIWDI